MTTLSRETPQEKKTLFRSNPVLNRMNKITERSETNAATYAGIATKTTFFLLMTLVGIVIQLLVSNMLASEPVWQSFTINKKFVVSLSLKETYIIGGVLIAGLIAELVGMFARKTIPVTGTIYAASQGYFISFLVFKVLGEYSYLGLEALLLTVAVVLVMGWLYTSGVIKVDRKFRTVLLVLVMGSVAVGLLTFIGSLIPATRPFVQSIMGNPGIAIAVDMLGLLIASLFLISDFSVIQECVERGYPKDCEWYAAFGLAFTVIWIYLKILDLLMQIAGNKKDS